MIRHERHRKQYTSLFRELNLENGKKYGTENSYTKAKGSRARNDNKIGVKDLLLKHLEVDDFGKQKL